MRIAVNGEEMDAPDDVAALVAELLGDELPSTGLAVAVDGEVVPRSDWADTKLAEGATVEIVNAVQGGCR